MKVYTVLTTRDPEALQKFAQTCKDCGATGVTIFTRPSLTAATPPPDTPTPQEWQTKADQAAARKEYKEAAEFQAKSDQALEHLKDLSRTAAEWIKVATRPINEITQLIVVGNAHWPVDTPFTAANFLAAMPKIGHPLISTGIGGVIQKTPLEYRTFIPLAEKPASEVAAGSAAQGESARAPSGSVGVESPGRHPSLPKTLTEKQAEYAARRLGLDRKGQRRSKQEAGNMMGWSHAIATKMEMELIAKWPQFEATVNGNEAPEPSLT